MEGSTAHGGDSLELQPLIFNGPVPKPHPPCTDPTPDEQYRMASEEQLKKMEKKDQKAPPSEEQPAPEGGTKGSKMSSLFSGATRNICSIAHQVSSTVERAAVKASNATGNKMREINERMNHSWFKENFPHLRAQGETLVADYPCSAIHGPGYVHGRVYITANNLCFSTGTSSTFQRTKDVLKAAAFSGDGNEPIIRQIIPLADIASIQLSVHLETVNKGPPYFMLLPAEVVIPTCLQVFTRRQQVFQFFSFGNRDKTDSLSDTLKGKPVEQAYNYIDHVWRAATTVPLPGVQYTQ
ncbi:GRAM domain containing protein [Trypanosoma brucei equiperdum]|uniref:GRAM domain containing protein n=1 Tax=Trypanosoma brucei equiperdum TaxID=630700 RepID=A0A3L6L1Q1_9TRYP|nr:GRAM domain containing protein [Trypanosoma brucei equiperdum]